jgi:long-chain fatty acid transport protein
MTSRYIENNATTGRKPMRDNALLRGAPLLCAALLTPAETLAGAFQIREGSAAAQGSSLAGRTSGDRDVSFALHNPAALRTVENFEGSLGLSGIIATGDADTTIAGTRYIDDPNEIAAVPAAIAGWRLNEHVVFGLATKYDDDWIGAADGVESELINITVTPLVSVQPVEDLSLGFGVTLSYADAKLTNRTLGGLSTLEGDDFAWGFTLGALADIAPRTTVGVAFISPVDHTLEGEFSSNYIVPNPSPPPAGLAIGGPGEADLNLPPILSLGVTHGFTDAFRMMAEVELIGWSTFASIDALSRNTGVTISERQDYDDAFMVALGAEYDLSDRLTLRGGVAYDKTPSNDAHRTVRVPDADRYWLSAGLSYELTERVGIDAAYTFVLFDETSVTLKNGAPPVRGSRVDYDNSMAHVVSVNTRFRF